MLEPPIRNGSICTSCFLNCYVHVYVPEAHTATYEREMEKWNFPPVQLAETSFPWLAKQGLDKLQNAAIRTLIICMLKTAHKAKNTEREKPVISARQLPVGELTEQMQR